jgi:DNA-directed RNA polymerase subunit alpha
MWNLDAIGFQVIKEDDKYGEYKFGPLESGFGLTFGTALRRVLLSSIKGVAPVGIYIDGVLHEFSTINGVVEDVEQIILNIKKLIISLEVIESTTLAFDVKGEQELKASDLKHTSEVKIINPDLLIATVSSSKGHLSGEIYIKVGKGYKLEEEVEKEENFAQTVMPIDAFFSPVEKVNFHIEQMRFEESVDYDSLILGILTKGNKTPQECLKEAVQVVIDYTSALRDLMLGKKNDVIPDSVKKMTMTDLKLSKRALNVLKKNEIKTVADLLKYSASDLLKFDKFGQTSLKNVVESLKTLNLKLKE